MNIYSNKTMLFRLCQRILFVLIFLSITHMLIRYLYWLHTSSENEIDLHHVTADKITDQRTDLAPKFIPKIENSYNNSLQFENSRLGTIKVKPHVKANEAINNKTLSEGESEDKNRRKVQSLILSHWRSGSSFFGGILHSIPESFYSFEPLMFLGTIKIRDSTNLTIALETLRQILQCNYTGLDDYFQFKGYEFVTSHNTLLWKSCQFNRSYCSNPTFVSNFCQTMPYQITKEVRLLAEHSEELLADPNSNVKIVLLIRDPRGIMHSRSHEKWCEGYPDCENVTHLCNDMVADFKAAEILTKKYSQQFAVLRYEELSMDPFKVTKEVFQFYGLPLHEDVKEFLVSHTQKNEKHGMSIFRNSKTTPFRWVKKMNFSQVQSIQSECSEAMSLWGYQPLTEADLTNRIKFDPLLKFPFHIKTVE